MIYIILYVYYIYIYYINGIYIYIYLMWIITWLLIIKIIAVK